MSDDPSKPLRFPFVAAVLCAACLGMATWTWMQYSCVHKVTLDWIHRTHGQAAYAFAETYVEVEGHLLKTGSLNDFGWLERGTDRSQYASFVVWDPVNQLREFSSGPIVLRGRIFTERPGHPPRGRPVVLNGIDVTSSRLTGASVAGLVVGAMGVFVFTVALRHWLGERRRFREDARA
ncbi:MAG: hypothetical protein ACYSU0_11735 [Planctomycetota bacterium]|jgi:hypothetical protein